MICEYMICEFFGKIVPGKGRGKSLGFPTINLRVRENLSISYGVYAVRVDLKGILYFGAMHFGPILTFSENTPSVEIHLLDFVDENLKNSSGILQEEVQVQVYKKIRDTRKFESLRALSDQIALDILEIRKYFVSREFLIDR